jgi:hypothetical protein
MISQNSHQLEPLADLGDLDYQTTEEKVRFFTCRTKPDVARRLVLAFHYTRLDMEVKLTQEKALEEIFMKARQEQNKKIKASNY